MAQAHNKESLEIILSMEYLPVPKYLSNLHFLMKSTKRKKIRHPKKILSKTMILGFDCL